MNLFFLFLGAKGLYLSAMFSEAASNHMDTFSGPQDTYKKLVEDADDNWLFGLVAFAVIEEQRIEWMKHHEETKGVAPSDEQIHEWYAQQPTGVLLRAKGTAESALKTYAEEVAATLEEDYRREIQDGVLIDEIRSHNRFWPQFGINIAAGLTSAILFSAILIIIATIALRDPSPVGIMRQLQGTTNGK